MKAPLSLKGRALTLLAQREQSASELRRKLLRHARADEVAEGDAASRVELTSTGVLNGDLKAASLTVAAGSRMRGNVAFGWDDVSTSQPRLRMETDAAS